MLNTITGAIWSKIRMRPSKVRVHHGRLITTLTDDNNRRRNVKIIPLLVKAYFPNAPLGSGLESLSGDPFNLAKASVRLVPNEEKPACLTPAKERIRLPVTSIKNENEGSVEIYSRDRKTMIVTHISKLDKTYFPGGLSAVKRCIEENQGVTVFEELMGIWDYDYTEWVLVPPRYGEEFSDDATTFDDSPEIE